MSTFDRFSATSAADVGLQASRSRGRSLVASNALTIVVLLVVLVLGIVRIEQYPAAWFDEGSYLEVSRNFAEERQYAARSADGTLDYAPVISVGPTVLLPVAGSIWLQGNSIQVVRTVALIFLVLASFTYYRTVNSSFGPTTALIGIVFLISMPAIRWVANGRQVAGEVPAILFLFAGAALAFRSRNLQTTFLAGVVLGLAIVTKPQYLTLLPPSIMIICAVDLIGGRARPIRWYAAILAGAAATVLTWFGGLIAIIGPSNIMHQIEILRTTGSTTMFVVRDIDHYLATMRLVFGLPAFFLVIPATIYGVILAIRASGDRRLVLLSIIVFQCVWLTWFIVLSNGWARYAFPGLVVSTILMALLVADMFKALVMAPTSTFANAVFVKRAVVGVSLLAILLLTAAGAMRALSPIATEGSTEAQQFAAEMSRIVPADTAVDGWEPEINFLANRQFYYPPVGSLSQAMEAYSRGDEIVLQALPPRSEFLVIGEFGRLVGLYEPLLEEYDYTLRASIGRYELYQRNR